LGSVAEEAFEQALSEGLSPEEAGLRARDAVEEAFGEEFGPRGPGLESGPDRPGGLDDYGAVAEEAYAQALGEGASREEAAARGAAAAQEAFGADQYGPSGTGAAEALGEAAFERALAGGASSEEAALAARAAVEETFLTRGPDVGTRGPDIGVRAPDQNFSRGDSGDFRYGPTTFSDFSPDPFGGFGSGPGVFVGDMRGPDGPGDYGPDGPGDYGPDGPGDFGPHFGPGDFGPSFGADLGVLSFGGPDFYDHKLFFDPRDKAATRVDEFALEQQRLASLNEQKFSQTVAEFEISGSTFDLTLGSSNIPSSVDVTSISAIRLSEANAAQSLTIDGSVDFSILNSASGTITGTLSSGTADDEIRILGTRNFQDVTFSDIRFLDFGSSTSQEKLVIDAGTSLISSSNRTVITGFQAGSASTADIFDYEEGIKAGNGSDSFIAGQNLGINSIAGKPSNTSTISGNASGVIEFAYSAAALDLDLQSAGLTTITQKVVGLLESATALNTRGATSPGAEDTDSLLIFFETSDSTVNGGTQDAGVFRYQEGSQDDDFDTEITLITVFESVIGFNDANFV
jgi:hypothetical protein